MKFLRAASPLLSLLVPFTVLFFSAPSASASSETEAETYVQVQLNGRLIEINSEYFPNLGHHESDHATTSITSSNKSSGRSFYNDIVLMSNNGPDKRASSIFAKVTGDEEVMFYDQPDCGSSADKIITIPISFEESRCNYCWDSCFEKYPDGSDAHTNIRSVRIPEGVVALGFNTCTGTFGYSDPGFVGVFEPGCTNTYSGASHFVFAVETDTPGKWEAIGKPPSDNGHFNTELSSEHWMYGPGGIENAQGTSWYQYIWEMLDPTQPRMSFQVGNGGTWLGPTMPEWKPGDACRCDPRNTIGGETCSEPDLLDCTNGCCGTNGCGGHQTMEGGSGYWLGKLPTSRIKWTIGSSVGCYKGWSNSPLEYANSDDLECDNLGVIAVSNRLLYPPDGIGFTSDGMFGHAWINTPIGKVSKWDKKRRLTLILDTKNFQGPVAYMLPEYYGFTSQWEDQDGNLWPKNHFANTGVSTGGGAFEFAYTPVYGHQGTNRIIRIPKLQFPFNDGDRTVLMSAGKSYTDLEDLFAPLDRAMQGLETLDETALLRHDQGIVHNCNSFEKALNLDFEGKTLITGGTVRRREEDDGMCSAVVDWDKDSSSLDCDGTRCSLRESYKVGQESITKDESGEWSYDSGQLEGYENIPFKLRGETLDVFPEAGFWLNYDRREPVNLCGNKPARKKLYCRQTSTEDWIAWRWYKFSKQPGFNRVKLNKKKRQYLQATIEKLHMDMEANSPKNDWLKTPDSMPPKVRIDPKLLIKKVPKKFKYGYVPIVVYQGMEKPTPCIEN